MKTNKNNIPIIKKELTEADFRQRIRDREDRERQEGYSFNPMVISESQRQDRATGQHSGRA